MMTSERRKAAFLKDWKELLEKHDAEAYYDVSNCDALRYSLYTHLEGRGNYFLLSDDEGVIF